MRNDRSTGFTLVELLVAVAVIGVLLGILLPAVQMAREAGRRSYCANQIRQIDLGLHHHADTRKAFPAGAILSPGYPNVKYWYDPWYEAASSASGMRGTSWMLQILPYIEQNDIYSEWNFFKSVIGNALLAQRDIAMFYCPSRRAGFRKGDEEIMFQNWTSGGTDYGGCMGRCNGWRNEFSSAYAGPPKISHNFLYGSTLFRDDRTGIFVPNRTTKPSDIIDGLSNTIMIGEMQRLHSTGSGSDINISSATSNDGWATAGVATLFNTMQPLVSDADEGAPGGFNNWFFESAGSQHPDGANFGMADGAVRFLNENMDAKLYARMGSMADGQVIEPPMDY